MSTAPEQLVTYSRGAARIFTMPSVDFLYEFQCNYVNRTSDRAKGICKAQHIFLPDNSQEACAFIGVGMVAISMIDATSLSEGAKSDIIGITGRIELPRLVTSDLVKQARINNALMDEFTREAIDRRPELTTAVEYIEDVFRNIDSPEVVTRSAIYGFGIGIKLLDSATEHYIKFLSDTVMQDINVFLDS